MSRRGSSLRSGASVEHAAAPGASAAVVGVGLVAAAIECFWRSAQIDVDEYPRHGASRRRWRLAGAGLLVAALGLVGRSGPAS